VCAVALGFEGRFILLLVEPAQEFLESAVGADFFHGVEATIGRPPKTNLAMATKPTDFVAVKCMNL
jgi:hypothetical protein